MWYFALRCVCTSLCKPGNATRIEHKPIVAYYDANQRKVLCHNYCELGCRQVQKQTYSVSSCLNVVLHILAKWYVRTYALCFVIINFVLAVYIHTCTVPLYIYTSAM